MYRMNRGKIRQVVLMSVTALVFGAGLVPAATSGHSGPSALPTALETSAPCGFRAAKCRCPHTCTPLTTRFPLPALRTP